MSFCCPNPVFAQLSRAAAKSIGARLRSLRALPIAQNWEQRAAVCERCPKRITHAGASYCGRPFLQHFPRDPVEDGCGCPTVAKAKDPAEHCPVDENYLPAKMILGRCTCKWCR